MKYPSINRDNIDFSNDTEICNIGYYEGVIQNERPYRVEVWNSYGITNATIFMSDEDLGKEDIVKLLASEKIIDVIINKIFITTIEDCDGNSFYSINVPLESKTEELNKLLVTLKDFE